MMAARPCVPPVSTGTRAKEVDKSTHGQVMGKMGTTSHHLTFCTWARGSIVGWGAPGRS
jgi:hypothetical protein